MGALKWGSNSQGKVAGGGVSKGKHWTEKRAGLTKKHSPSEDAPRDPAVDTYDVRLRIFAHMAVQTKPGK
jgi:hypothetical protein